MIALSCTVRGNVQGVGFRSYVADAAINLGLVGYVKNQADGAVIVVAEGLPENLRLFVEYLHEGSVLSRVDDVAVEWGSATEQYSDFSIMR